MDTVTVNAKEVANLISSLEANHIVCQMEMAKEDTDWERVAKWKQYRQEDYAKLKAMGIPVYNPETDKRDWEEE